jgi:hypothetical protein
LLASPVGLATAAPLVADELGTLLVDRAVDAADAPEDIVVVKFADPVAVDKPVAVPVLFALQTAAVGRFVTPAGTQMLSAYWIVSGAKCENYFGTNQWSLGKEYPTHSPGQLRRRPLQRSM